MGAPPQKGINFPNTFSAMIHCSSFLSQVLDGIAAKNPTRGMRKQGMVLFLPHTLQTPAANHKVSAQAFGNRMVGSGTLTCTPENYMVALGTLCTPGSRTDEQLRRHHEMHSGPPPSSKVIKCIWQPVAGTTWNSWKTVSHFLKTIISLVATPTD